MVFLNFSPSIPVVLGPLSASLIFSQNVSAGIPQSIDAHPGQDCPLTESRFA